MEKKCKNCGYPWITKDHCPNCGSDDPHNKDGCIGLYGTDSINYHYRIHRGSGI